MKHDNRLAFGIILIVVCRCLCATLCWKSVYDICIGLQSAEMQTFYLSYYSQVHSIFVADELIVNRLTWVMFRQTRALFWLKCSLRSANGINRLELWMESIILFQRTANKLFYDNRRNSRALIGSVTEQTREFIIYAMLQRTRADNLAICYRKKQIDDSL